MGRSSLHFLLVPDGSAARRLRRTLAEASARSGVVVGTWPELLALAQKEYFISFPRGRHEAFDEALAAPEDAFWSKSYASAPEETARAIEDALTSLLMSTDPGRPSSSLPVDGLRDQPRRIITELFELAEALDDKLPGDLATVQSLLQADPGSVPQLIRVYRSARSPVTTRWQDALVEKLNRDAQLADGLPDPQLQKALDGQFQTVPQASHESALGVLQRRIFKAGDAVAGLDDSVQWIGVRDFYQEAEVTAGMIQSLLDKHPDTSPADIGLLVPDQFEYSIALEDAFKLAGIPLSGLQGERWKRNLGAEAVYHFLYCRQKPAPRMALAICLSSVLMPWTVEEGAVMAQAVMDGNYDPRPPQDADRDALAMIALLKGLKGGDSEPERLAKALREYATLLDGGEAYGQHEGRAREIAFRVIEKLGDSKNIDWSELRREALPRTLTANETPDFNIEGVTVWRERHEPWRPVRHLFVLGFEQGRYPHRIFSSPVFANEDIVEIRKALGLQIDSPGDIQHQQRHLFRRQLSAVSDSVTILIPRRRTDGAAQLPSESLLFMRRLVAMPASGRDLIAELDSGDDIDRIRHLALAEPELSEPPREFRKEPLRFNRNLLALRTDEDGNPKPESPSGLEMPLVSSLGWLMSRLHAVPLQWEPESGDNRVVGSLAHKVFEELFQPGCELPAPDQIHARTREVLDGAIQQQAPFFRSAQWQFERMHLAEQAARSAQAWREIVKGLGARVLGSEQWLQGSWGGIDIYGQADLILGLGEGELLVVDYKWSKSTGRRKRMERGYDSQASLYRAMLETGGLKPPRDGDDPDPNAEELAEEIKAAKWIGIVYYTMRDHSCLSDSDRSTFASIPRWIGMQNRVAENASGIIQSRLEELRNGIVRLNFTGDGPYFYKHGGVPDYALEVSPLISLFSMEEPKSEGEFNPWEYRIPEDDVEPELDAEGDMA